MTRKITGPQDCTPQHRTLKYDDERLRFFTAEEVGQIIELAMDEERKDWNGSPTKALAWHKLANELQGKANDT